MSLSKDLISQFVKATKDTTTVKKESTVYGTVVKYNEKTYVKIDGSDLLTPAETLSSVEEGERVSIMIKDHTATITGNYTAPSASSIKVDGMDADLKANTADIKNLVAKNAEIENLVASKATIEDLRAANAEIDTLKSNYAEIETLVADKASIGDLAAVNADIKSLKADKADIAHLEANYATIGSLNAVYADVTRLEADKANIKDLEANYATIESLEANYATINQLETNYATIKQLDAANANITNLQTETANINTALIDKANVSDLAAANAVINDLKAGKADIGDLSAANAKIADLEAGKADISVLEANYATIKQLDATNANVTNLQTETANINKALIDKADISDLNATNANITNLQATKANVSDLNATNANINTLTGDLAEITTLVNGNLTSDNIQSMVITGDKFTVEDGFIKNAMIDTVNASKINTGILNTNNVSIQSNDGSMVLQGNLQQFKDKNGKVRIQIGKDATGNFTFVLYDENGTGQLINQNGIQSSNAIADGLIVDSKVADNANIAGSKLDIDSVVTEVNNGTTSIKGTKIYLDDQKQSLNVAFNNMSTTVKGNTNTIQSHTTSINTMNGKVTQLISDTTITKQDGTTTSLKDAYNATVDTVDSHSTKIGSLETNLATANNNISSVSSKQSALEQNLNGFKQTVSDTYTTKAEFDNLSIGGRNYWVLKDLTDGYESNGSITSSTPTHKIRRTLIETNGAKYLCYQIWNPNKHTNDTNSNRLAFYDSSKTIISSHGLPKLNGTDYQTAVYTIPNNAVYVRLAAICGASDTYDANIKVKFEFGNKPTSWTPAPEDIDASITAVDNKFTNYSTTSQMNSAINQKANEITSTVSETYATKASLTTVDNKFADYSTTSAMNSAINQKANEITSSVSETYATKTSLKATDDKFANYSTTSQMNSAINQKSDAILSTVSSTYATKTSVTDVSNNLKNNYSTTSAMNSAINQKANEITSSVSETYATKTALTTVDNKFANYSTTSAMNSAIQQKSDAILSTVSSTYTTKADFNGLTIGGTNLLPKSGNFKNNTGLWISNDGPSVTLDSSVTYGGYSTIKIVGASGAMYNSWIQLKPNTTYTYSVLAKASSAISGASSTPLHMWLNTTRDSAHLEIFISHNSSIGTKWTKAWVTFKTPNNADVYYMRPFIYQIGNATVWLANSKVEEGNKSTDWSPVPADVDASITAVDNKFTNYSTTSQMNSAINQKANEITSTVSNTYATKAALNTVDGKFADYSTTSAMNSAINQKANEITSNVSETYATKTALSTVDNKFANYSTTSQMNSAIQQKSDSILSTVSNTYTTKTDFNKIATGQNKWLLEVFDRGNVTGNGAITIRDLVDKPLKYTRLIDDTTTYWSIAETYLARLTTNVYLDADYSWTVGAKSDDGGTLYLNGQVIATTTTTQKDVTLPFKKGWNKITWVYNENAGDDGAVFATKISSLSQIKNMNAYPVVNFDEIGMAINNDLKANYSTTSAMNSAINQKANEITSTVSQTYATKTALNTVDGKFANYSTTSAMNSAINQKANEITSSVSETYATKTALTTVDNKFSNYSTTQQMNSAIQQKSDSILSSVSQTYSTKEELGNLKIGGTNLFVRSDCGDGYIGVDADNIGQYVPSSKNHQTMKTLIPTNGNTKLIYQVWNPNKTSNSQNTNRVAFFNSSKTFISNYTVPQLSGNEYQTSIIDIPANTAYIRLGAMMGPNANTIDNAIKIKFEFGNKATDWSPAPEDVDNSIATVDGKFASYSTTSQMNSAINQKANEITSTVSNTYATKTALNTVDGKFANYSTTSAMNSAINQKGDSILSTVSNTYTTKAEFNSLDIGGNNILPFSGIENFELASFSADRQNFTITGTHTQGYSGIAINPAPYMTAGQKGILQFKLKKNSGTLNNIGCHLDSKFTFIKGLVDGVERPVVNPSADSWDIDDTNWHHVIIYFTYNGGVPNYPPICPQPNRTLDITVDVTYKEIKVEIGNKPSAWSPCIKDIQSDIATVDSKFVNYSTTSQMNSAINQKANEINLNVSNTYATKTSVTDLSNNLTNNYSTTQQMNSAIDIAKSGIKLDVSQNYASKHEVAHYFEGENKWKLDVYSLGSMAGSARPTKESMAQSKCQYQRSVLVAHPSYSGDSYGNNYVGYATTHMYFTSAYQWTGRVITDDNGTVYLNDALVLSTTTCQWANITLNFKAGWNKIEVLYAEGSGGDGWQFDPEIKVGTGNKLTKMNCYGQNSTETYLKENYSTTQQMNTAINQKADSITQSVSNTYATKTSLKSANDNITSLTNRMKSAESKLTKDSLTTTIGNYYTTSSDVNGLITTKGYATTSQVSQTATDLTAKFSSSGGYNLLRNSVFTRDTSYWSTGSHLAIDTSRTFNGHNSLKITSTGATSNVWRGTKQNFVTNAPSGKTYTASLWYYVADKSTFNSNFTLEIKGKKTGASSEQGMASKIISASNLVQGAWTKISVTVTTSESWEYIFIFPWVQQNGTVWITELQVEEGPLATLWSPHPYETYDGITQINKDGIKVYHTNIDGENYTHMAPSGFYIKNKGVDIFKVDSAGLYVKGNGEFTGKITSTSGAIGGYTISDYIIKGTNVGMSSLSGHDYAFWAGASTGGSAPFRVGHDGSLNATQATISGTINSSTINSGTINGSLINGSTINSDSFIGDMLAIDGVISAKSLQIEDIDNAKYPGAVTADFKLYVSTSGNDDSEIENGATFATFDGLLDKLPKNLNGHEVRIEMSTNITENVDFKGFFGGKIRLYMKGHTLYGYVVSRMGSARINICSGYIGNASDTSNGWGKIHPSKGYAVSAYTTTVASVDQGAIGLYNIDVYGADNYLSGSTTKLGVAGQDWGTAYLNGVSYYGCDIGARANAGGRIHDVLSYNVCTKYGFYATTGGYITLAKSEHSGGKSKNYHEADAGKVIVASGATFASGEASVPGGSAPVVPTTKTITIKSTYGDTYRSSVYKNWKKDGTVRQGDYGYGDCNGCWFFGDAFSDLEGKTINKVTITITRQSGGSSSAVGLVVKSHGHSSRPSGAPTFRTTAGTLSLAAGKSGPLVITNSTILNEIKSGVVKGFGIQATYDSSHYAVCSGSVTVKIEYQE